MKLKLTSRSSHHFILRHLRKQIIPMFSSWPSGSWGVQDHSIFRRTPASVGLVHVKMLQKLLLLVSLNLHNLPTRHERSIFTLGLLNGWDKQSLVDGARRHWKRLLLTAHARYFIVQNDTLLLTHSDLARIIIISLLVLHLVENLHLTCLGRHTHFSNVFTRIRLVVGSYFWRVILNLNLFAEIDGLDGSVVLICARVFVVLSIFVIVVLDQVSCAWLVCVQLVLQY